MNGFSQPMFDLIGFDADDTLWENNALYLQTTEKFSRILAGYGVTLPIDQQLEKTEVGNLAYYGYGVMSFVLSLIEVGIQLTSGRISTADINAILAMGKEMITTQVRLYHHAEPALIGLSQHYRLLMITKGELTHQLSKVAQSGLRQYFSGVEVVPEKNRAVYTEILAKHGVLPERFLMVGDSLRSDVLPVLELGGWAAFVPNDQTWTHEQGQLPLGFQDHFIELENLGMLPATLEKLEHGI
jgi:putative hydrolase of the HAD superfamily